MIPKAANRYGLTAAASMMLATIAKGIEAARNGMPLGGGLLRKRTRQESQSSRSGNEM